MFNNHKKSVPVGTGWKGILSLLERVDEFEGLYGDWTDHHLDLHYRNILTKDYEFCLATETYRRAISKNSNYYSLKFAALDYTRAIMRFQGVNPFCKKIFICDKDEWVTQEEFVRYIVGILQSPNDLLVCGADLYYGATPTRSDLFILRGGQNKGLNSKVWLYPIHAIRRLIEGFNRRVDIWKKK